MKLFKHFLALVIFIFAITNVAHSAHYTFNNNTDNNMTIVLLADGSVKIGNDPVSVGDEIAAFTSAGVCVGAVIWDGNNTALAVFGFNTNTNPNGPKPNDIIYFRVWDDSEGVEYSSVSTVFEQNPPFDVFSNVYQVNGFAKINSLIAAKKPAKPSFTNPTNNAYGIALSGNLTINAAAGANTHTIQLSTVNTFVTTLVNASGNITSAAYNNLSYNTTYYARARGTNGEGDGEWENISFTTLLSTPTLNSPNDNSKGLNESAVSFAWSNVSGATSYLVQVSKVQTFASGITEKTVNVNSATINGLDVYSDYYWRVKAQNSSGNFSNFSAVRTFKTRVGVPVITSPANNAKGVAVNGNVTWNAVSGATSYDIVIKKLPNTIIYNTSTSATSFSMSNLDNFTDYEINLNAKNADGVGDKATSTFKTIIGVPSLVSPANNSFDQALAGNLSWNAVAGATSYDVQLASDVNFNTIVFSQNDVNIVNVAYAGLNTNQKYYWRVRAKNADGTSAYSNVFAFTTILAAPVLASPTNNQTQVSLTPTLSWNAVAGATSYQVQVSTNNTFTNIVQDYTVNTTSKTISELNSKSIYYWRVRGFNINSNGQFSNAFKFTTMLGKVVLNTPTNGAQGIIAASGTLKWQSLTGATSYDLLVSTNQDLSAPIININVATTTYNYNGLNNNTTYYWAVKGRDADGPGAISDTWNFGTQVLAPNLLTPANNATNIPLQGSCSWSAVAGATSYQVQIATDNTFNNIVFDQSGINGTSTNYSGLVTNSNHYWRVRGYKGTGAGIFSSVFTFKTMALPPPTAIFPPNNAIDLYSTVNFVWQAVQNATGYNLRVATDVGMLNVIKTINNIQGTQKTVTDFILERTYFWQVQTISAEGVSNWSPAFKFSTLEPIYFDGDLTICENKQATYSIHISPLVDYNWTVTGGTVVGSSTSNTVKVNWGAAGQGTIKLTRTSAAWGNYSDNLTKNIVKTSVANVDVTLNANTYYPNKACLSEPVSMTATINSTNTFSYVWKLNNIVVSNDKDFVYTFTNTGTYNFVFTAIGDECEYGTANISVVVDGNCPITVVHDDIYTCKNSSPILTNEVFGGSGNFTYSWSPANDFVNASVQRPIVKSAVFTKNYYLTVKDVANNNTVTEVFTVNVYSTPTVSFSPASLKVKNNSAIDLTDPSTVMITITGGTTPYTQYWRDINGNQIDPTNLFPQMGTNRYYLTVTDDNGCTSVEKQYIVIRSASKDLFDLDLTIGLNGFGTLITYPNPVVNELNVVADFESNQNVRLRIMNMIGQNVYSLDLGNIDVYTGNLDLSKLSAGVYTLIIESDLNTFTKTFIKQ